MGNGPYELVKASKFPKNYGHSCKTRGKNPKQGIRKSEA